MHVYAVLLMCKVEVIEAIDEGIASTLPLCSTTQGSNTIEESLHFTFGSTIP